MNDAKYIGLDVHQATISAAVFDSDGRLIMESILETKAATILQFIHGLRGSLHVTFEEGTCAATEKCPVEIRQQERPNRCSQTGRSAAKRPALAGLPR